jgi:molecular chaperone DnaK
MEQNVGIDLGTTNSVVAFIKNGKVDYVKFRNKESLPSVLFYQNGKSTVGEKALKKSVLYPNNFISSSKTYMGDISKKWKIEDKEFTPVDVASEILSDMLNTIQKELSVSDGVTAVITVPAYFTSSQIDDTKKAAENAGFKVKQIITEPVSAAIAYGFEDQLNQKIFIVDIGGGTFDTAVLEVSSGDFKTIAIGGDNHLGGDDFNKVILDLFLKHIRVDEGVNLASLEKSGMAEDTYRKAYHALLKKAEEVKIELSEQEEVDVSIANLFESYNFETKVTREMFESSAAFLFETIKREIEKTIDDSKLSPEEIDKIVLVGGSSRIPAIRDHVVKIFGTTPYADKPLDKLVAMGAAIASSEENTVQIRDILSHSLGTELVGDKFSPIIPKNTQYPVSKSEVYTTASDYQTSVQIGVYEGEDENIHNNAYYGGFELDNIEYAKKGIPQIEVTFSFDKNRILHVTAKDLNTNASRSETIEIEKGPKKK